MYVIFLITKELSEYETFVQKLNRTRRWIYEDDLIKSAGMQTQYEGLDYLTVRGAGHMVAMDRPKEALQMIANFLWHRDYSTPTGLDLTPQPLLTTTSSGASMWLLLSWKCVRHQISRHVPCFSGIFSGKTNVAALLILADMILIGVRFII